MEGSKQKFLNRHVIFYAVSCVLLFLYPLRHVHQGVDLWDGGYNYANFSYNGLEYMDSMWYFATWIANAFGNLLTRLPFGSTMLGMNVYTGMVIGGIALTAYVYCVQKMHMPAWMVFAGEILALSLCWAPSSALYNYMTYGLLLAGTLLLYHGLTTGKDKYLVLAGVALGCNVGVRFSNLVQAGLIVAVWYYAFLRKKKFSEAMRETFLCILGYVGAFALFLAVISVRYGLLNYVEGIRRLFAMTEHATDYSALSMLIGMVWAYYDSSYWLKRFALAGACALAVCLLLPKKWVRAKRILTGLITLALMWWLLQKGYCTWDYATYNSVYYPCIIIFEMAIALSVFQLFDRKAEAGEKLRAVLVLLMVSLTSLGGNNAIYSSINNLFFVLPCFFWMAYKLIRERKDIWYFPFQTFLAAGIVLLLVQGLRFGNTFVYEEATGGRDFNAELTEVPVLKGMHTSAKKAEELEALYQYLTENGLQERTCILYGNIPGISYYMGLAPAINIWSDLRSYSPDTMQADLQKLAEKIAAGEEYPIVILNRKYLDYYSNGDEGCLPEEETERQKLVDLCKFMDESGYAHAADYVGESFVVFTRE